MKRVVVALLVLFGLVQAASAQSMTWRIRAFDKHAVDIAFYSQNRKHEWPGGGQVWVIRDYDVKTYKISCVSGEKICYGAWVRGSSKEYWGVGKDGRNRCKSCCYSCQDGFVTPILNLNE
ncbi:MAG: hypothetical protein ACOVOC_10070 [Rhabdaerophilum sp.]